MIELRRATVISLLLIAAAIARADEWNLEVRSDDFTDEKIWVTSAQSKGIGDYIFFVNCRKSGSLNIGLTGRYINPTGGTWRDSRRVFRIPMRFDNDGPTSKWFAEQGRVMFLTLPPGLDFSSYLIHREDYEFLELLARKQRMRIRFPQYKNPITIDFSLTGAKRTIAEALRGCGISWEIIKEEEQARQEGLADLKEKIAERITEETKKLEDESHAVLEAGRIEYIEQIKDSIERNWLRPPGIASDLKCVVRVLQLPGGHVIQVDIQIRSGNVAFDRSVEEAVLRSSPLPVPKDPALFDRTLVITFEPEV